MAITKVPPAAKYPGLSRIQDADLQSVLKNLFDMVGQVQQQVPKIGTVTEPLAAHLDANANQIKAVADPTAPQDAVTLRYLQHYVESRVTSVVAAAAAPAPTLPPSNGPVIPNPPGPGVPPVVPPNAPPGSGTFLATDMFALNTAIIENSPVDIATWPQTATLTVVDWQSSGVFVDFTTKSGVGRWPDTPFGDGGSLQYTIWLFEFIGGQWFGSGVIQFWFGLDRNGGPPSGVAANWFYDAGRWGPLAGRQPAVGEQVGFMVSAGNARGVFGVSSVKERTQVVLFPFPSDNGAGYHT
jgi:hypothetical protein